MQKLFSLLLLCVTLGITASGQEIDLPHSAVNDETAVSQAMPELAKRLIAVYREPDRSRYLNNLFQLQLVAGQYSEAVTTLQSLSDLRRATDPALAARLVPFEMIAKARAKQAATGASLGESFKQEFREVFGKLDDKSASRTFYWFGGDLTRVRDELSAAIEKQKGKDKIALTDALNLIRSYNLYQSFEA